MWVVAYHVALVFAPSSWWAHVGTIQRGWSGVDLFFVLSGFILMHAHASEFQAITRSGLRRFAWSRLTRIYPLNFAVLALILIIMWVSGAQPGTYSLVKSLVSTALLITVWLPGPGLNQPTWSLSAEMVGYVAFPVLAYGLGRVSSKIVAATISMTSFALLALLRVAMHHTSINAFQTTDALARMGCCFAGGSALCRVRALAAGGLTRYAAPAAAAATIGIGACSMSWRGAEALPALYGLLILALSYQSGAVSHALSSRFAVFLGAISFPLYLCHLTVLVSFSRAFQRGYVGGGPVGILLCLGTCLVVATVLHWSVERPSHDLAKRLGRHFAGKRLST